MNTLTEKDERKQLEELLNLKEFSLDDTKMVLDQMTYNRMPHLEFDKKKPFKNQGKKCKHGENGCVTKDHFEMGEEAIYLENNLLKSHFLTEGSEVLKSVAMVTLKTAYNGLPAGKGWGTGFLVSNSLFMTNNHVIPNKDFCKKIHMQFNYQDDYNNQPINSEFFETNENSFFYTNPDLDFTIVRLNRNPYRLRDFQNMNRMDSMSYGSEYADSVQIEELKYLDDFIARRKPISAFDPSRIIRIFGYTPGRRYNFIPMRSNVTYPIDLRLNVIQHPQGRKKEVVIQQNKLNDVHTNIIHYFSDTDYGSSGSPVFNNTWDLMALHHARYPQEQTNEGIRIDKIVTDLQNKFEGTNTGILAELGI